MTNKLSGRAADVAQGYFSEAATVRGKDGWWSDLTDLHQPGTWTWGGTERVTPGALWVTPGALWVTP